MLNLKKDFPLFQNHPETVYLDTAATAQKPRAVIDAMTRFLENDNANVHRGLYGLSQRATLAYENARQTIARFINAGTDSIVFTKNATEAINLVAYSFGSQLKAGDEIVISELEHHANIVPWHLLRQRNNIVIKVAPITDDGFIDLIEFRKLLSAKTRLVAVSAMSNALGTIQPVQEIIAATRKVGAKILLDACQAISHLPIDVKALDCDFLAFSGHKLYGPSGIGVLYGRHELLQDMPPFLGGGDMIDIVTFDNITYAPAPRRFEAGTPPVTEAVGLAAAMNYLTPISMEQIRAHDTELLNDALEKLHAFNTVKIHADTNNKGGIISFSMAGAHPQDIATILGKQDIAVRAGHHCCMPLMQRLGVSATTRLSFGIYNDKNDIDAFIAGLKIAEELCA